MPEPKTHRLSAIPLAKFEAKSSSHVMAFFTLERGQIRAVVRGTSGKKKPASPMLPLFSTYEILFKEAPRSEGLFEVKERETSKSRPNLNSGSPIFPWAAASLLAELICRSTELEAPDSYLFRMLDKALDRLEKGDAPSSLIVSFMIKFLEHVGHRPRLERETRIAARTAVFFDVPHGGIYTAKELAAMEGDMATLRPQGRVKVKPAEVDGLLVLRKSKFEDLDQTKQAIRIADKWLPLLASYIEYHTETRLKSLSFWEEIRSRKN